MKRTLLVMILALLLCGCQSKQTFEVIEDVYLSQPMDDPRQIVLSLPKEAVLTMSDENSKLYFCNGYEIALETYPSGDLAKTIQSLTGFEKEMLTIVKTGTSYGQRYECAWSAVSEAGDVVGRAIILDDGNYFYCLCIVSQAEDSGALQQTWMDISTSFSI